MTPDKKDDRGGLLHHCRILAQNLGTLLGRCGLAPDALAVRNVLAGLPRNQEEADNPEGGSFFATLLIQFQNLVRSKEDATKYQELESYFLDHWVTFKAGMRRDLGQMVLAVLEGMESRYGRPPHYPMGA